jgi:hypothetical protein
MRTLLVALGIVMAAPGGNAANAVEYPWCADLGKEIGATNCGFVTIEQCRATVFGVGGSCVPNPFYRAAVTDRPVRAKKASR